MGYDMTFYGKVPREFVTDPARVGALLQENATRPWPGQSSDNRYPELEDWVEADGGLSVLADTKDWGNWVEESLRAIAPYITGRHEIQVDGEDGVHWVLILMDHGLYTQPQVLDKAAHAVIWTA